MKRFEFNLTPTKKNTGIPLFLIPLFFIALPAFAAAPDGASGPWADSVVSFSQGLTGSGAAVPAARSDPTAALGVAENDTVDSHFFSLGFGGNIVLGFDNGISSGVFVVEATNPGYPLETAKVEVSENNINWVQAGNLAQSGTVTVPEGVTCAKFVRITDTSDPTMFFGLIGDDGYDVDGAQALGATCTPQPVPTNLHVIKQVVNSNGSIAVPSNFSVHVKIGGADVLGSPAAGTSTPGTLYSLVAGTYAISEDASATSTVAFSGDCDATGIITLQNGDNKTCIVTNTEIVPAPSTGGGGGSVIITPRIGITKLPNPSTLPAGPGSVTYSYTVFNAGGQEALTDVTVTDNLCSPLVFLSGDSNGNGKLDPGEIWNYNCSATLLQTSTNTATATGHSDNIFRQTTTATAVSTVVVGGGSGSSSAGSGGSSRGSGPVPGLPNTGSGSGAPNAPRGNVLDTGSTRNLPNAAIVPRFPNTGFPPQENNNTWIIAIASAILMLIFPSVAFARNKLKA